MFGFGKEKQQAISERDLLLHRVRELEEQRQGRVLIERHAIDHLSDFVGAVANLHPNGQDSQHANDLRTIHDAIRMASWAYPLQNADAPIQEVFDRYDWNQGNPITLVAMLELAEWILAQGTA